MGKKTTLLFKLVSSAGTGFYYYGEKNTKYNNYI
jgi:large subunit ribosomal protein L33